MKVRTASVESPVIHLSQLGAVKGTRRGNIFVFHGLPYARPPIGRLRFAPPEPVEPWDGMHDAGRLSAIAPQTPSRAYLAMGPIEAEQDEDCLTVTVWTPDQPVKNAPVIVWIHGGAFLTGGGALPWYDGEALARRGIIVVAMNYRLGALGFMASGDAAPGNLAILDQQAALRWIQAHIAEFGGDPRNVTAMGQSGGAHNILSHITLGCAPDLFARAILMSPPLGVDLQDEPSATRSSNIFLEALGLDPDLPDLAERLKAVPVADLLSAQTHTAMSVAATDRGDLRTPFMPTSRPPHMPAQTCLWSVAGQAAAAQGIDIMIGWTRQEAALFYLGNPMIAAMTAEQLGDHAQLLFGSSAETALAEARSRNRQGSPGDLFVDLVGDKFFRLPALAMAKEVVAAHGRIFTYEFDWRSSFATLGACHCLELPFVFGTYEQWGDAPMLECADQREMAVLSAAMIDRWTSFAADGDPGFPAWNADAGPIMHFGAENRLETP